jgi:DNA adenine methylase
VDRPLNPIAAGPVLKWAGGKQGIADELVRHFPRSFGRYHEPFVGGASVFLSFHPTRAVLGDANEWLIDTYRAIREDHAAVARILDGLVNTREEYLRIRAIRPEGLDLSHRAAHLIYLNKTCFRGLFRVNKRGQFNVPYGRYDRRYYDPANLRALAAALQQVELRHGDFEMSLAGITADDFAYLDPPYYKLGGYSDFNRYTRRQFREADHFRLASACRELHRQGVRWAVSNSGTEFVRGLFAGFRVVEIDNRREINLNAEERSITELLILNYRTDGQLLIP